MIKGGLFLGVTLATLSSSLLSAHAVIPAAPTNVSATNASLQDTALSAAQVQVSWTAAIGALGYVVSYSSSGQAAKTKTVTPGTATSVTIDGLIGGTTYSFIVSSKNADGEAAASAVKFLAQSVPDDPGAVSVEGAKGQATLTWRAPTNTGGLPILNYKITADGFTTATVASTETKYSATGLKAGSLYTFSVQAINAIGKSNTVAFTAVKIPEKPDAPTNLKGDPTTGGITASWTAPAFNGNSTITAYTVYVYDSTGTTEQVAARASTTTTSASISGLLTGTYTLRVSATNAISEGDKSALSSAISVLGSAGLTNNDPEISPAVINSINIDSTLAVGSTTPSRAVATITVAPASVCVYSNSTGLITGIGAGTCTITAHVAASGTYAEGTSTKKFDVTKIAQSITFTSIRSQTLPFTIDAVAASSANLAVSFSASGSCTLSGSRITGTTAGICSVTASAAETSKYSAATAVTQSFSVAAAPLGGGGGGGGGLPLPIESPSPSATHSATPTSTPTVMSKPEPSTTPTPKVEPTPKSSTSVAAPSTTLAPPAPKDLVIVKTKANTTLTAISANTSKLITIAKTVQVSVGIVAKGIMVVQTIKGPSGSFTLSSAKTTSKTIVNTPVLKFSKPGTYTLTVMIGKTKKVITFKVTK